MVKLLMLSGKTKFKLFFLGGPLVLAAVLIGAAGLTGRSENTALPVDAAAGAALSSGPPEARLALGGRTYAFDADADRDGLSDAKEYIFGTDPDNPDTDNDTYKDGGEVEFGYDPSVAGNAKLTERPNLSLTIRYFLWTKEKTGNADPALEESLIQEFFKSQNLTSFKLPALPASAIQTAAASAANIESYLAKVSVIGLPQETQSYSALATDSFQGKAKDTALKVADDIAKVREQFSAIPAPPQALDLHKQYLSTLMVLEELFRDLALAQKDPVRVSLNEQKGQWLATELSKLETMKQQLINALQ